MSMEDTRETSPYGEDIQPSCRSSATAISLVLQGDLEFSEASKQGRWIPRVQVTYSEEGLALFLILGSGLENMQATNNSGGFTIKVVLFLHGVNVLTWTGTIRPQ